MMGIRPTLSKVEARFIADVLGDKKCSYASKSDAGHLGNIWIDRIIAKLKPKEKEAEK